MAQQGLESLHHNRANTAKDEMIKKFVARIRRLTVENSELNEMNKRLVIRDR